MNNNDKLLLARLEDKQRQCERRQYPVCSDFLDPRQQALAAAHFGQACACGFWGGFAEAERRALIFLPDYLEPALLKQPLTLAGASEIWPDEADCPLLVLRAAPTAKQSGLMHRDYLGALLALGVQRGKTGDILVQENFADIVILRELADYLLLNFERAGRCSLRLELLPAAVLQANAPRTESLRLNVSSLRLDTVAAAAFGSSRGKTAEAVAAGLLAVDGLPILKADFQLAAGAKITWQGKGKIRLAEIGGKTRKDRLWLQIEKYI